MAAGPVATRFTGVHRPSVDPQRLAMALSGWDIQANRALVSSPSAATLSFICQQEASLRSTARVVLGASAVTGHSDSLQFEAYARPALEGSQLGWARQARDWSLMSPRRSTALPPEPLQAAALELRAATREITHNDGTMATPDVVASRLDVGKAALNVQSHLASSVGIAHAVRQAGQDPDLAVFSQGAKQVMQREGLVSQQSLLVANVLQSNKTIRMPGELRVLMDSQGSRTLDLSKHAHSTTARLLTSTTSPPTETSGAKKPAVTAHERLMSLSRSKSVTSGPSR
ncbi:hypothetical protein [Ornithinimicrobium sp. INDO-MA30-4]|uniref:hypothetical protein n=1 Tax=Ornithinimicrobium sp. INDO-MA30-4 TaxID=2908651 RepID=UPI001F210894|nr:hypothetical protein [Ornithinimicrobium sp. INDO-MA30-4]UJH71721.1 hypothetical protein L0A91_16685 [Ornithinimicrobium sp. INDO-MA30-4]